jgi:hypothetical protein
MKKLSNVQFIIKQGNTIYLELFRKPDKREIEKLERFYSLDGELKVIIGF